MEEDAEDSNDTVFEAKIKKKRVSSPCSLTCDVCNKVCYDRSSLVSHKAIHSATAAFKCNQCPYRGKTKRYLSKHIHNAHTERTRHECEVCGKKFHYIHKLENHRRVHTGEKPYECKHCGKRFSALYCLKVHLLVHSAEKPYKCSFCEYACRDSSTLRKHQNRHMGLQTLYKCKMCDKNFKQKFRLKSHIAEVHLNVEPKRYDCGECGKQFKEKATMAVHVKTVHKIQLRCACKICGCVLSSRYNMSVHMRVHTDARPYECTFEGCGKKFKDQSTLKKHVIIHYPSKHFKCKVCGKLFARVRRLEKHMEQHRERTKSVRCEICGVCFYNEAYLQAHYKRKHDRKRKRYECDLCSFMTTNKPSIVMHLKYGHAKDNDIKCKLCNIIFKKQEYLKQHFTRKHNIRYKPMKRLKKKPKNTKIIIKDTADHEKTTTSDLSSDEKDIMELQDAVKLEDTKPRKEDKEAIMYSDAVFSEDVARSYIKHNSEKLTKLPEDVFDTFFIEHVYLRCVEKKERVTVMAKDEEERGIKRYKQLLSEIIGGTEVDIPDTARRRSAKDIQDGDDTDATLQNGGNDGESDPMEDISNMHRCHVCFEAFDNQQELSQHSSKHNLCNEMKKCPFCDFVTNSTNFSGHMRKAHTMHISCNYGKVQDIDGKNTFEGNDGISRRTRRPTKTKLVKVGNEWLIQSERGIGDYVVPDLGDMDNYMEVLREKCRELKMEGRSMLFPCRVCEKKCRTLAALTLHLRVHENEPRPFSKSNGVSDISVETGTGRSNDNESNRAVSDVLIDGKCVKIVLNDCMKDETVYLSKNNIEKKRVRREDVVDPPAGPKRVTSKGKYDKKLVEFYETNIKGSGIEFWQFLYIFNKMPQENFEELDKRKDSGMRAGKRTKSKSELRQDINKNKDIVHKVNGMNKKFIGANNGLNGANKILIGDNKILIGTKNYRIGANKDLNAT